MIIKIGNCKVCKVERVVRDVVDRTTGARRSLVYWAGTAVDEDGDVCAWRKYDDTVDIGLSKGKALPQDWRIRGVTDDHGVVSVVFA